jgi:hypothetical protein
MSNALFKPTALVAALSVLVAYGCGSDNSDSGTSKEEATAGTGNEAGTAGSSAGSGGSSAGSGGSGFVFDGGMAGGAGGSGPVGDDAACAAQSMAAEKVPVDLYFMVDISGSMNCPVGPAGANCEVDPGPPYAAQTRWTEERAALKAFFGAPESSGLGAGIAFFPKNNASGQLACTAADYATPSVEIAALPAALTGLSAMIDKQRPGGNTPTNPSLQGAIQHAREWAANNSGHTVAVVYATDGYPRGCTSSNSITNAAAAAAQALQATPSIKTFVLGVGPNLTDLNQIAVSGGTSQAYFVDTGQNVGAQLTAALASIRTSVTLACTYNVPPPPAGQQLDYGKVNVRYTNGAGDQNDLPKDPSASDCTQGWQYSADRSQIVLCGSTCDTVKNDPDGKIDILFGCSTVIGQPR